MKKYAAFCCLVLPAVLFLSGCSGESTLKKRLAEEGGPSEEEMRRLAVRALHDVREHHRKPVVHLEERLDKGDYRISVLLDDGRICRGRLFKDRARFRIALDPDSVRAIQINVKVR